MTPKFKTVEELQEFLKTASPEEVAKLNQELTRKLVKKILLAAGIGVSIAVVVALIAKALEEKEESYDNLILEGTDTTEV